MKKLVVIISLLIMLNLYLFSSIYKYNYKLDNKYNVTIRANVKLYINNKYIGLNSKEIKVVMSVKDLTNDSFRMSGDIYKLDKTLRNNNPVGYKIDTMETSLFNLFINGSITSTTNSYPLLYNVPLFPDKKIEVGDTFENQGSALIDPYDKNETKLVPIIVSSKYVGKSEFFGASYELFEINYGYKSYLDKDISKLIGLHKMRFYFDSQNGVPVYMDDHFTDEILLSNGDKIKKNGFYLYFYKPIEKMNKESIIRDLTDDIIIKDKEIFKDLDIQKRDNGISITINNLKFKPDSKELLDSEKEKVDLLSNLLKKIKNRSFMIVGHTALSGSREAQLLLSEERAKTIKDLLIDKGIEQQRLMYIGKGADNPIAPNDTEENRQKNRRVEIIVLED